MKDADLEKLSVPFEGPPSGGPGHGLAESIGVSVPTVHELHQAIQGDLDAQGGGIRWWRDHLDPARSGFIGEHLAQAVWSVRYDFLAAGLHLLELEDWLDRESDAMSRSLGVDPTTGRPRIGRPRPTCAADELPEPLVDMHTAGFLTSIGSALDCLGATIVGVAALPVGVVGSSYNSAMGALRKIVNNGQPGPVAQAELRAKVEVLVQSSGPAGWEQWVRDYRNMVVHRARRLEACSVKPVSVILDHRGQPLVRSRLVRQLPRDPTWSESQAWLEGARTRRPPVLTEDARTTLNGIKSSARSFIDGCAEALLDLWRRRREQPSLLVQPVAQWPRLEALQPGNFVGYAPETMPYQPGLFSANPDSVRRLQAAQVLDGQRERLEGQARQDGRA